MLLELLYEYDKRARVPKNSVNMRDLAALTAKTGDEFAMFTKGNERLIIRGNFERVNISFDDAEQLSAEGYRWSGHTHPGTDKNCLTASDGDFLVLQAFKQSTSSIYNSIGDFDLFREE